MILSIIGIVLGVTALSLIYWLRKEQTMDNDLNAAETQHTHQGMNAMMDDFNNYQVKTNRKIAELEKQLEIKTKQQDKNLVKLRKELPSIIGQVVGQIELAQDRIKRQM
tara:strand:+ start:699 stop:1025 length:327 start_codon:yes stop_codon:yes gene_type:complete